MEIEHVSLPEYEELEKLPEIEEIKRVIKDRKNNMKSREKWLGCENVQIWRRTSTDLNS